MPRSTLPMLSTPTTPGIRLRPGPSGAARLWEGQPETDHSPRGSQDRIADASLWKRVATTSRVARRAMGVGCWAGRIAAAKASPACSGHLVHGHLVSVRVRRWAVVGLGGNLWAGRRPAESGAFRMTPVEEPVGAA